MNYILYSIFEFEEVFVDMAKCDICEKDMLFGRHISITRSQVSRRAKRNWKPNVRKVRVVENGTVKSVNVCTRCLRSNKVTRAV